MYSLYHDCEVIKEMKYCLIEEQHPHRLANLCYAF